MTEKITLANWQSIVKQMREDFLLKHKYEIAGKFDGVFEIVAKAINNDKTFDAFRRQRVDETIRLHQIDVSAAGDDEKQKSSGQAKIDFINASLRALKDITRTGDAKKIASAVRQLSTELSEAVTSYTAGMATSADAVKDPKFLAAAKLAADGLRNLLGLEKPRLAAAGVYYSVDSVKALRALDGVKTMLDAAAAPSQAETVPAAPESTVDITA